MRLQTASSARNAAGLSNDHRHVVQFYEDDEFLFEAVSGFLIQGLKAGQPTVVFARPETRRACAARIERNGCDYSGAIQSGRLVVRDAREALATFMRGSMIDETRFINEVGTVVEKVSAGNDMKVRAYGEMVDVLFRDGNAQAALRLEELWNELAQEHAFELLCAYSINNFYTETHAHHLKEICRTHSHVVPAETYVSLVDEHDRALKIVELQQHARALQVEIEHRKAIERALREALAERQLAKEDAERASTAKSEFLAVISHELRTPLTAIIGYEELMEHGVGGPITEQQQAFLAGIKSGATHLLRLIDQILTQSRIEAGKESLQLALVDLGDLVNACAQLIAPLAAERGLLLNVQTLSDIVVETDAGKVEQIMLNLLSNAVKFTHEGAISVRFATHANFALIDVTDTGIGIDRHQLARIFQPFEQVDSTTTRTHGGAGLGLSVSRRLAELLGGDVEARSARGTGSTFTLRLPLGPAPI